MHAASVQPRLPTSPKRPVVHTPRVQIVNAYRQAGESFFTVRCEHRLGDHVTFRSYTRSWQDFIGLEKTLVKSALAQNDRDPDSRVPALDKPFALWGSAESILASRRDELEKWMNALAGHSLYGRLPVIAAFFAMGTLPHSDRVFSIRKSPSAISLSTARSPGVAAQPIQIRCPDQSLFAPRMDSLPNSFIDNDRTIRSTQPYRRPRLASMMEEAGREVMKSTFGSSTDDLSTPAARRPSLAATRQTVSMRDVRQASNPAPGTVEVSWDSSPPVEAEYIKPRANSGASDVSLSFTEGSSGDYDSDSSLPSTPALVMSPQLSSFHDTSTVHDLRIKPLVPLPKEFAATHASGPAPPRANEQVPHRVKVKTSDVSLANAYSYGGLLVVKIRAGEACAVLRLHPSEFSHDTGLLGFRERCMEKLEIPSILRFEVDGMEMKRWDEITSAASSRGGRIVVDIVTFSHH